ncbi:MAG: SpoIVB peptidase [Anaerovorax sp.]
MQKNLVKKVSFTCLALIIVLFLAGGGLLSAVPNQEVTMDVLPERVLVPGGHSIGVKMDVKGVLVVGLEEIEGVDGQIINPGLKAGLQIGDSILEVNGEKVDHAAAVQDAINKIHNTAQLKIKRKDQLITVDISPVLSKIDGKYKIGVWVKDKTAGIGTLTFYDPQEKIFGALGHAITDPETGTVLPVAQGELLRSKVESVKHGKAGKPGEIRGIFYEADAPLGVLKKNSLYGIFGHSFTEITNPLYEQPLRIGSQNEVKKGSAYILTTLEGNHIEKYEVSIEKIHLQSTPNTKSMVIQVTDKRLLEKSGGIVQGMSGSPIIQDNKIIGAVTHVFVNDPEKGYGVFIEWMLQEYSVE